MSRVSSGMTPNSGPMRGTTRPTAGAAFQAAVRWPEVAAAYGLTVEELETAKVSPLDRIEPVVKAGIPIIGVSGDADVVVKMDENLTVLAERYRAAGGNIEVIVKPGAGHSPHSLPDPKPIVDFILKHAKY